jgi:hypothetical protein
MTPRAQPWPPISRTGERGWAAGLRSFPMTLAILSRARPFELSGNFPRRLSVRSPRRPSNAW